MTRKLECSTMTKRTVTTGFPCRTTYHASIPRAFLASPPPQLSWQLQPRAFQSREGLMATATMARCRIYLERRLFQLFNDSPQSYCVRLYLYGTSGLANSSTIVVISMLDRWTTNHTLRFDLRLCDITHPWNQNLSLHILSWSRTKTF